MQLLEESTQEKIRQAEAQSQDKIKQMELFNPF
jgi:hypothetical protein